MKSPYHAILDQKYADEAYLRRFYTRRIADLQANCSHEHTTDWLLGDGYNVKLCTNCYQEMAREYHRSGYYDD